MKATLSDFIMPDKLSTLDKVKITAVLGLGLSFLGGCIYGIGCLVRLSKESEKAQTHAVAEARSGLEALVECYGRKTGAEPAVRTGTKELMDGVFLKPATLSEFLSNASMEDDAIRALKKLSGELRQEPSCSGEVIPEFMARYSQVYACTVARLQFLRLPFVIENMKTMRSIKITGNDCSRDQRITTTKYIYSHTPPDNPEFRVLLSMISRYERYQSQMWDAAIPLTCRRENVVFFDRGFLDGYAKFLDSYMKAAAVLGAKSSNRSFSQNDRAFVIPENDRKYVIECTTTSVHDLVDPFKKYDPDDRHNARRLRNELDVAIDIRKKELEGEINGSKLANAHYFYALGEFLLWDRQGCLKITTKGFEVDRTRLRALTGVLRQYITELGAYATRLSVTESRKEGDLFDFPEFGKDIFGEDIFLYQKRRREMEENKRWRH